MSEETEDNKLPIKSASKFHYPRNWDALKLEFFQGPWDTLFEWRRAKGYPDDDRSSWFTHRTKGWTREKQMMISQAAKKAAATLFEDKVEELKKVRERQAKLGKMLQEKGEAALVGLAAADADEARKLIMTGVAIERAALGIGEKGGNQTLTQVNVNLPKTKFDEIIDGQDTEGILKLLADVRRERTRRTRTIPVEQSETEDQ